MRDASRVFGLGTHYAHPKVLGTCTRVRLLPNLGQRGESNPITSLVGLLLQLPRRVVTATASVVLAAAAGCLGFLGHDVGRNVLHFLSLLVQGTLGYAAFTKRSD